MAQSLVKWVPPGILAVNDQARANTEVLDIPTLFQKLHELQLAVGIPPTPIPTLEGRGGDSGTPQQQEPPDPGELTEEEPPEQELLPEQIDSLKTRVAELEAVVRAFTNHVNLAALDWRLGQPLHGMPALTHIIPPIPVTALTIFATAESSSSTIAIPICLPGDLILLGDRAENHDSIPVTWVPSGFTPVKDLNTSSRRFIVSFKIANAQDSGRLLTGMGGNDGVRKLLVVLRANAPLLTATLGGAVGVITNDNPPGQTIPAAGIPPALVALAWYCSSYDVDSWTLSPAETGNRSHSSRELRMRWRNYLIGTTPANLTLNMDDEGSGNGLVGFYLRLTA